MEAFESGSSAAAASTSRLIGTRIGHLAITRLLGEGGMGAVYAATHEVLGTQRAIKVLLPQWTQNAMIVQRFINEARAAASIHHRNIIAIHDCGQLPDGCWYIVMDHLDGQTLAELCASRGGSLEPHLALRLLAPIANGLEAAHAANIVHRDLKPDNIFLIRHEHNALHPVVLDFGIAKLVEREQAAITQTGVMAGTPAYMAPEQMRDLRIVDRRTDVYALGVIAYRLVTGWMPFESAAERGTYAQLSPAELYHRQMSQDPIDPRARLASLPDRWATAILSALDRDAARRPQTARAFVLALAQATPSEGVQPSGTDLVRAFAPELLELGNAVETIREPSPGIPSSGAFHSGAQPLGAVAAQTAWSTPPRPARPARWRIRIAAALAGLVLGGFAAYELGRPRHEPAPSPAALSATTEPAPTPTAPALPAPTPAAPTQPAPTPAAPALPVPTPAAPAESVPPPPAPTSPAPALPAAPSPTRSAPPPPRKPSPPGPTPLAPAQIPSPTPDAVAPAPAPISASSLQQAWRSVRDEIDAFAASYGARAEVARRRWLLIKIGYVMTKPELWSDTLTELAEIRKLLVPPPP